MSARGRAWPRARSSRRGPRRPSGSRRPAGADAEGHHQPALPGRTRNLVARRVQRRDRHRGRPRARAIGGRHPDVEPSLSTRLIRGDPEREAVGRHRGALRATDCSPRRRAKARPTRRPRARGWSARRRRRPALRRASTGNRARVIRRQGRLVVVGGIGGELRDEHGGVERGRRRRVARRFAAQHDALAGAARVRREGRDGQRQSADDALAAASSAARHPSRRRVRSQGAQQRLDPTGVHARRIRDRESLRLGGRRASVPGERASASMRSRSASSRREPPGKRRS